MVITTLAHHIDIGLLREAHRRTRKDGAVGVDGQTAAEYAEQLDENLASLLDRLKSRTYKAPPVRRALIPKGSGSKTRPIGIPTFEDKVLQRAVAMVVEAVYEQDFLDCSYGFRPGRSPHQALDALRDALMEVRCGWVLEVDVRSYFDTIDHAHLRSFLDKRVRDGVLRCAIDKWLKAGVLDKGCKIHPEAGTPQGGVASPLLANIYLHEVLDLWFEHVVKPRLRGTGHLVRFADDFVIVFAREDDARRVMAVLPKRFGKFGLSLHPEKTRLLDFRRPAHKARRRDHRSQWPGTFSFLGFTHYWARSRKGYWVVKRKTAGDRQSRAIKRISDWGRRHRHMPLRWQQEQLARKLRGHYAYYGITGNARALQSFHWAVIRSWRKWLSRRSQRGRLSWSRYLQLLERFPLPAARIVHSVYRRTANLWN
jgi:group II intron reverse transcriptase/maturase